MHLPIVIDKTGNSSEDIHWTKLNQFHLENPETVKVTDYAQYEYVTLIVHTVSSVFIVTSPLMCSLQINQFVCN